MSHDLFLACERGAAPYAERELAIKGLGGEVKTTETTIVVKDVTKEDLVKAAYLLQSPVRIGLLLGDTDVTPDLEESVVQLETLIGTIDFNDILPPGKTFLVACDREGEHEYNSIDMSQEAGRLIKRHVKEERGELLSVHLKKPDVLLHLHIDGTHAWLSLDLVGKDAAKRAYKVFNNPHSIKGPTAASLVMASGWRPGESLLDPYASDGVIPIEASLMASGQSIHYYGKDLQCKQHPLCKDVFMEVVGRLDQERRIIDPKLVSSFDAQLRNVSAAKKNAKIAGVDKYVQFSKLDVEWLDTKLEAKSVKRIVTQPVEASKHVQEQKAVQLHKHLFYQADFVLSEDGTLTFLCQRPDDLERAAQLYGFSVREKERVFTGKLPRWILSFARKR
ncbi:hypothetical protein JXA12_02375 [Candidatus Woesearchaeota archaeon]|nr:hypothetical protein [Candidatus Woesearchaeota archaeon]